MKKFTGQIIFLSSLAMLLLNQVFSQAGQDLLLKDYKPVSIYKIPVSYVPKSAYPITDMHSHDYAKTDEDVDRWVKTMDSTGIEKVLILTYSTGKRFDSLVDKYKRYPNRFVLYCGFEYTGFSEPGWEKKAIAELERCYSKGARGIGELGDKGEGELYSKPTPGRGIHIDNPKLKPLLKKCADLKMPVIIHIGEDRWMYEKPDASNDGMMNAAKWHVNMDVPEKLDQVQLLAGLQKAATENPGTIFVACHFANCCADLTALGKVFDKCPNLYADIAARYGEIAPIPHFASEFIKRYQDRLVYGTDMGLEASMYRATFRILETADEHFYEPHRFSYHWPLYGLNLPKPVLQKLYQKNAEKILNYKR
jgi:uncharacterized protein